MNNHEIIEIATNAAIHYKKCFSPISDKDDFIQVASIAIFFHPDRDEMPERFAMVVAKNAIIQELRRHRRIDQKRKNRPSSPITPAIFTLSFSEEIHDTRQQPILEKHVIMICDIEKILNSLSENHQNALYERFFEDMTFEEMGAKRNTDRATAQSMVLRAIGKAREFLNGGRHA